jgi:hypothetical protein
MTIDIEPYPYLIFQVEESKHVCFEMMQVTAPGKTSLVIPKPKA